METGNLLVDAQTAFAKQRRRRRLARARGWLLRHPVACRRLASLEDALGGAPPRARRSSGLASVPVCSIVGTAEPARARTFDADFRPPPRSRLRWERLWMAARRGEPLPPIAVYRLGERYYVGDGHHRVSVARALGAAAIDAEVIELDAPPPSQPRPP